MEKSILTLLLCLCQFVTINGQDKNLLNGMVLRWCVQSNGEMKKCKDFVTNVQILKASDVPHSNVIPQELSCVRGKDVFDCMRLIEDDEADVMSLDTGQAYFAGRYYNLMPIMSEKYSTAPAPDGMNYYAVAVTKAGSFITVNNLKGRRACFPGIGTAAGWRYPIGKLMAKPDEIIQVTECNAVVKTVTKFFSKMCLPGALTSFYNPFGNNPTSICEQCAGILENKCSTDDPYAGYDGAFRCMDNDAGDIAFLRHDTVNLMSQSSLQYNPQNYELVCPDGRRAPIDSYATCNFGSIPSNPIMVSSLKSSAEVNFYKAFLFQAMEWFGPGKIYQNRFSLFTSSNYSYFQRGNLMFTDSTLQLTDVGEKNTYYSWVDQEFYTVMDNLNACPILSAKLCVISKQEKAKCEMMMMAFDAKDLRPSLDCVKGSGTEDCMRMISRGDADMMVLDAGDIYLGGRKYGLIPIVMEDYGNMNASFYVVAVARKRDSYITLFNLKNKRVCLPGIGRGDGWVVPMNVFIETEQFLPQHCSLFENLGQLFIRSCIPGAMDQDYNPNQSPVSLCEGCAAGGFRKCQRTSEDQYYGASGAFRCLVEKAGDVAFVRHLTVRDNTDGRRKAIWARNRRSDDYELMCKDGSRTGIDNWSKCYLGLVPANAVVTAQYKSAEDKLIYWQLFNYGQQFFSSDVEGDFHLFDSGTWYNDLIFTDDAVRLMKIPPNRQNYLSYLGSDFVNQIENLHPYTCVPISKAAQIPLSSVFITTMIFIIKLFL